MKALLLRLAAHVQGSPELVSSPNGDVATKEVMDVIEYAPMSTLLWCLSSLAAVYFLVCSLLLITRVLAQLRSMKGSSDPPSNFQSTLAAAELTVESAPMLCVLFLAAQMQAMHASDGREDPSVGIRRCMEVATAALLLQTLLTVLLPSIMGKPVEVDDAVGLVGGSSLLTEAQQGIGSGQTTLVIQGALLGLCQVISYLASFTLYGAIGAICIGVMLKHAQMYEDMSPFDTTPAVSPAVSCTVNLTIQFFAVRLLLAATGLFLRGGRGACSSKLFEVLMLASSTVFFAPMLCVLFIAAQIRAVQVGHPLEPWAQAAFHICAMGVLVQTVLTIALPYLPCQLDARRGTRFMEGDVQFGSVTSGKAWVRILLTLMRYVPMLFVCVGFTAVIVNLLTSASPSGQKTPPVPPAMQCATALTVQFFLVYLGLRVAVSIRDVTHGSQGDGGALVQTFYAASATVHFCPMLAILFMALRMRVQQISGTESDPQGWAQDAMYLCTGAVMLQLFVCLLIGCATGSAPEVDEQNCQSFHVKSEAKEENGIFEKVTLGVQVVALALLYGGAIAVCVALFTVTPATAGAHGAVVPTAMPDAVRAPPVLTSFLAMLPNQVPLVMTTSSW